jgi:bifunctional UDP-N-acetylglucosamine pyrophosphorylase/glucosamine-1-phosphate N-acetyltransferase
MAVSAIVLAAGEGTRMRSTRPKPLHMICGRGMVMHVIHALESVDVERTVVVVGHGAERVTKKVQDQSPDALNVVFVEQAVQRGTPHRVNSS